MKRFHKILIVLDFVLVFACAFRVFAIYMFFRKILQEKMHFLRYFFI